MVFGRGKPTVEGLENNEEIIFHWNKISIGKKKKNVVLTNKRFLFVDRDTNQITDSDDIHDLQVAVSDVQKHSDNQLTGQIEIWINGTKRFWIGQTDPYGFRDKIQAMQSSTRTSSKIITDGVTITKGSLPTGFSPTTSPAPSPKESTEDPLSILKIRLVKGEISKEDFEEMKEMLEL